MSWSGYSITHLVRQLEASYEERDALRRRVKDLNATPDDWKTFCRAARLWDLETRLIPKLEVHLKTVQASSATVSAPGYRFLGTLPYFNE